MCNSQSKAKPKSAAAVKATTNGTPARGGRARGRGGRNGGRPKRKTADELDAEMVDYFDATAATNGSAVDGSANMNGIAQQVANDDGMDEISVRPGLKIIWKLLMMMTVIVRLQMGREELIKIAWA